MPESDSGCLIPFHCIRFNALVAFRSRFIDAPSIHTPLVSSDRLCNTSCLEQEICVFNPWSTSSLHQTYVPESLMQSTDDASCFLMALAQTIRSLSSLCLALFSILGMSTYTQFGTGSSRGKFTSQLHNQLLWRQKNRAYWTYASETLCLTWIYLLTLANYLSFNFVWDHG